jgi:2-hydroxycyclohexanecarboxyl-CoA dehydrogenase
MRLASEGAAVAVLDLRADLADEAAAGISAAGGRAIGLVADISLASQVAAAVAAATAQLGPIDILVNNAGWEKAGPFLESDEATWDRLIAVNLKGPIVCCRAVLDSMVARGYGRIVSIGSDAGRVGSTGEAVYSAAKGGVIAFTKTLAREVARNGVTVNCVCPGPTDTQMLAELGETNPRLRESLARAIPLGRLGEPADIAAAVAFLVSDDASFITGQTLSVSGGLTMS